MPVAYAQGMPDNTRSGSAYQKENYSSIFLPYLYAGTILPGFCTTEYLKDAVSQGSLVVISSLPTIVIRDHVLGEISGPPQRLSSTPKTMSIDYSKQFLFAIDDVEAKRDFVDLAGLALPHALNTLAIAVEKQQLNLFYLKADAANYGKNAGAKTGNINLGESGTPVRLDKNNLPAYMAMCSLILDEQNVPYSGRWMAMPMIMKACLSQSDIVVGNTGAMMTLSDVTSIGSAHGFKLYPTNNYDITVDVSAGNVNCYKVLFGGQHSTVFATQLNRIETFREWELDGTIYKGTCVYGSDVVLGEALGYMYATFIL